MGSQAGPYWGQAGDLTQCPLQKLPEHWDNNKKLCLRVAENAAPLQAAEAAVVRQKCQDFEVPAWGLLSTFGKALLLFPAAGSWLPSQTPSSHAGPAARLPREFPGKSSFLIHRNRPLQLTGRGKEGEDTRATAVLTGIVWLPLTLGAGEGQPLQVWLQLPG